MDRLDLRKATSFVRTLAANTFLHIFPAKCLWKMLTWQFGRLFSLSMELFQCQVKVGRKDSFCPVPLAKRFPSLLSLLLSQERQSQQRALAQAVLNWWICQCQLQNQQQMRANQDCFFPGQPQPLLPAWKPAQGSFFPQDLEEASVWAEENLQIQDMFCLCHHIPAPLLTALLFQGVSTIPWDLLPRRNQQFFWARAGAHPSCVWHLTNEAGLRELHSWTGVSKFHCSLGSRNVGPSGPRSFRAQLRAQSTKSSPLISPRAASQEYEIFHGTEVPFSHLGSLAQGGLYSRTIQWFPSWLLQELIFQTSLTAQCRLLWKSQP